MILPIRRRPRLTGAPNWFLLTVGIVYTIIAVGALWMVSWELADLTQAPRDKNGIKELPYVWRSKSACWIDPWC